MQKTLKIIAAALAGLIALAYTFGYGYLFRGIRETYLRGESSANINDGRYFSSHTIAPGTPILWEKAAEYNQKPLPKNVLQDLKNSHTAALVIIKNGKLLHEQYWDGYTANMPTNSFSMAKTITTLLLGAAITDKKIKSENQLFSDFYENYKNSESGRKLTLKHLSEMQAGLNWNEDYKNPFGPNANAYYGNSLAEAVFLKGFINEPGTKFKYQSGATQLLGFAVRKAVGVPLASYASTKLWIPLGMESKAEWSTDVNGMEKTFCCIHSIPRDYAKLGQMMLDNGKVGSQQVIDSAFIQKMITPTPLSHNTYGLSTWINYDNPIKHYFFWGLFGQYIIVIPEKKMVIVRTGSYKDQPENDNGRPDQVRFLVNSLANYY